MFSSQKHIKTSELSCLNICFIKLLPLLTTGRLEHGQVIDKSLIYLTKLSKAFWCNLGGKVLFFSCSHIEDVSRKWIAYLFQLVAKKRLIVLLKFFTIIKIWWKQKSLCMHMHSCGQNEFFCWKVPIALPWWDACAGSGDCWLVCWAVIRESRAGATFVLILHGTPDSPGLLFQRH